MNIPAILDFFIFDIDNKQLITSKIVPSDILDSKDIFLTEQPIPGLNFSPINLGGSGNRHISFTIPLIKRDPFFGNIAQLKLYECLRQPVANMANIFSGNLQFVPNPKVLFKYGTGSLPLIYYVKKCDFIHKQQWQNSLGEPQFSEIQLEFILDENNVLNKIEKTYRQMMSVIGQVQQSSESIQSNIISNPGKKENLGRPY